MLVGSILISDDVLVLYTVYKKITIYTGDFFVLTTECVTLVAWLLLVSEANYIKGCLFK